MKKPVIETTARFRDKVSNEVATLPMPDHILNLVRGNEPSAKGHG